MNIFPKKQSASIPQEKNYPKAWAAWFLIIIALVFPPTLTAILSPNPIFLHFKIWGIEYQFQKGNIEPSQQKQE